MRVVRRITGHVRFEGGGLTDHEVRKVGCFPSIDCLIQRARIRYLARLIRCDHKSLIAILSARSADGDVILPWVRLVRRDLMYLYVQAPSVTEVLPGPEIEPNKWYGFMIDKPSEFDSL